MYYSWSLGGRLEAVSEAVKTVEVVETIEFVFAVEAVKSYLYEVVLLEKDGSRKVLEVVDC